MDNVLRFRQAPCLLNVAAHETVPAFKQHDYRGFGQHELLPSDWIRVSTVLLRPTLLQLEMGHPLIVSDNLPALM